MTLVIKMVKIDSKVIIWLPQSKSMKHTVGFVNITAEVVTFRGVLTEASIGHAIPKKMLL
jgi:hypothetical protein